MKKWMLLFAFLLINFLFIPSILAASSNDSTELQISNDVIKQDKSALTLLEQLVNINSGTQNTTGVHQVGEILRDQFNQLGFSTHWAEEPPDMQRAGTLIAEHIGAHGPHILLIGHLDTVFQQDSPFQKFSRQGNLASGPGVIDDKGGDIVILYALKALQAAHVLDHTNITVALTGDEEDSGKPTSISRQPLRQIAKNSNIALEFEWSLGLDSATISRRGISGWIIETHGKEAHSSEIFQSAVGDGAIYELSRILNTLRTEVQHEKNMSSNPGIFIGGNQAYFDKTNAGYANGVETQVAKIAMAKGDIRFISDTQKKMLEENLSKIVTHNLPGTTATIIFQDGIPAMPVTANNIALLKNYSQVSINLGYGPVTALDPRLRGGSDLSHIAYLVSSNLGGLGPYGTGAHSMQETLDINSLLIATQRTAILIYRLSSSK